MTGANSSNSSSVATPPSPHTIFEHLNGEIVGHYVMKKALSVAIYNHLCNVSLSRCKDSAPAKGSSGVLALHNSTVVRSSGLLSRSFGGVRAAHSPVASHSRRGSEAVVVLGDSPPAVDQYMSPCVARVIIEASSHRLHLRKQNILTFDATGSKKHGSRPLNAIATCIAKFVDVPFVRCDCSVIAPAKKRRQEVTSAEDIRRRRRVRSLRGLLGQLLEGAKRESVEGIVASVLRKANYDVERAERAVVFLDSMDEIGNSAGLLSDSEDGNEDANSDSLRQRLSNQIRKEILELIEGTSITVTRPSDGVSEEQSYTVNTKNMFFLCFGVNDLVTTAAAAKEGALNPVERRDSTLSTDTGIASQASESKWRPPNTANAGKADKDSIDSNFHSNSTDDDHADEDSDDDSFTGLRENKMAKLLLATKSSPIPEFQSLWGMKDVHLKITPEALEIIADQAKDQRAGAEGVRAILEKLLLTVKFAIPEDVSVAEVEITEETVLGKAPPIFHFATKREDSMVELTSHASQSTDASQPCDRPATCRSEAVYASNKDSLMSWLTEFDQDILEDLEI